MQTWEKRFLGIIEQTKTSRVDLSDLDILAVSSHLCSFSFIRVLNLSFNLIQEIPPAIGTLTLLEVYLLLSHLHIQCKLNKTKRNYI